MLVRRVAQVSPGLPDLAACQTKHLADEITVSAPCERVDLEALEATKARRKGADTVISSEELI